MKLPRDHFVRRLCVCVCLSGSHTFLVVTHSNVSQATHVLLGMLPLCLLIKCQCKNLKKTLRSSLEVLSYFCFQRLTVLMYDAEVFKISLFKTRSYKLPVMQ